MVDKKERKKKKMRQNVIATEKRQMGKRKMGKRQIEKRQIEKVVTVRTKNK